MSNQETSDPTDINNIKIESLEYKKFPVRNWEKFRVYFHDNVIEDSFSHAKSNKSVEIGGLLLGNVYKDSVGPYVCIEQKIDAKEAVSGKAQITFTHDTWAQFHEEIDSKYPELKIIGWYHSHPGFGIFLSEMDLFIHKNFFTYPWQIALVIDPISSDSGVFVWKNNEVIQSQRYFTNSNEVTAPTHQTFPEIFSRITLNLEELLRREDEISKKLSNNSKIMFFLLLALIFINLVLYVAFYEWYF